MAQKQRRDVSDRLWLESLIESFEATSCGDGRAVPCDRALLTATREHLEIHKGPRDGERKVRLVHAA
ncbi:hypothetical protein SR870_07425 [Rhodopseudomonas palustris]|uniref:hypothetical protein n=1 Tax=Rhodopseudomonas palustris TaxID=1076 RepID=UPI002ACE8E68|nr:hypothetical protein [Rhodopseudomonas palustris]WQH01094.1 hypothetical protein SR870_07425 [Rhodopseudomonas palustris]